MLVTLNTLFARSRRQKRLVLSCVFSHLEIAIAAVRVAEHQDQALLLTLDATRALTATDSFLISATLLLARTSSTPVAVEVLVEAHREAIERAFDSGATVITPRIEKLTQEDGLAFVESTATLAAAFGAETILSGGTASHWPLLPQMALQTGVQAVRVQPGKTVDLEELYTLARDLKLPLITEEIQVTPAEQRKLSKTGIAAVSLDSVLEEAFTAGLRTGLRDRSLDQISRYLRPANLAVEDSIINLLRYLKT